MDAMKPPYYRSVSSKGAGQPRLTQHHKGWWNETKWMRWGWRKGGMKFVVGENGRNPVNNLPRPRFVHHETHMEGPRREPGTPAVEGERLTASATRPPIIHITYYIWGRKVIGISGSLIWSKTLMELIFNPCSEFSWSHMKHFFKSHLLKLLRDYLKRLCPLNLLIISLQIIFSGHKRMYDFIIY